MIEKNKKIAVAMSGGVDSSTTAAMLMEQGHQIFGITMKLFDHPNAQKAVDDAKEIADKVGIEHHVLELHHDFKSGVIDPFLEGYIAGETPLPCAVCNKKIKFGALLDYAKELGADYLATGHYVRLVDGKIYRGFDAGRDQSYFLFGVNKDQIKHMLFPLGEIEKVDVRKHAKEDYDLSVADKPDSQDICFVTDGDYAGYVAAARPDAVKSGDIVDREGTVLGQHRGVIHYTVGQRRGLGIGGGDPLYVHEIDAVNNRVIVGDAAGLSKQNVLIRDVNWLGETPLVEEKLQVKLRSVQPLVDAAVRMQDDGTAVVVLDKALKTAVAPGQACVFYRDDQLLGGGWIVKGF
ncbi:MAG: tRNA 2-thiouridine(34) synthase MnmA [Alphaproteobacteria bacterium]